MHDVYAYGVIAPSTLIEILDPYPAEAGYAEIEGVRRSLGGEAASGAYVLARLGVPSKVAGSVLGTDDASRWAIEQLSVAGVDCSDIAVTSGGGATEIVITSGDQRTVFGTYRRMLSDEAWSEPRRADVAASRMVCLDPFFGEASERVARWCRDDGIPYVTIDTNPGSDLARHAEAVVISQEYADRSFGHHDPGELLGAYTERSDGLITLTRGASGVWFGRRGAEQRQLPAFAVDVRDTAGAGDSFRAGLILGLLRADGDNRVVRLASALAAMVCESSPGVLHSPTAPELDGFLSARPAFPAET